MRFLAFIACALVGGFVPERHHPTLARIVDWATEGPGARG